MYPITIFGGLSHKGNNLIHSKRIHTKKIQICEDSESSTPPPPSRIEEDDEDSGFHIQLDWFVVLQGVVSGSDRWEHLDSQEA